MQVDTINATASPAGEGCDGGNVMKQQVTISILPPAPTRMIEKMATMATAAAATAATTTAAVLPSVAGVTPAVPTETAAVGTPRLGPPTSIQSSHQVKAILFICATEFIIYQFISQNDQSSYYVTLLVKR